MNVHDELKTIAEDNDKRMRLCISISKKIDIEGLDFAEASIIRGCKVEEERLYDCNGERLDNGGGLIDDDYFCCQHTGYCEDDYYGTVYFATNEDDTYIAIPFSC